MKISLTTLLFSLFFLSGFCQFMSYEVRGRYQRPVKKEKLNEARFISDFLPGYPTKWITEYISVEILATSNGNTTKAVSANNILSTAQKNILKTAELASDIIIKVHYKNKNAVTSKIESNRMNIKVTVVPEIEAEYIGGYQELKKYLKVNAIDKISEPSMFVRVATAIRYQPPFKSAKVIFTVNEEGKIVNAIISNTSGDAKTDKILTDAINKMPKWKPAENEKGIKVKQEFEFSVGKDGC